jgi:hypothetical protein
MSAATAKAKALELVIKYSHLDNVQDVIDQAKADNSFANNDEMLAVWGRVCRLLPQKQVA